MTLNEQHNTIIWLFRWKSHEKEVLHTFLASFVKNDIFSYLTLKLTFWPWRSPWISKIISEMDCPVKITWKWGVTLVPSLICLKIHFWPCSHKVIWPCGLKYVFPSGRQPGFDSLEHMEWDKYSRLLLTIQFIESHIYGNGLWSTGIYIDQSFGFYKCKQQ